MKVYICDGCGANVEREDVHPVQLRIIKPDRRRNAASRVVGHICPDCIESTVELVSDAIREE